jgi:undecaprenyl diphosphate synthase
MIDKIKDAILKGKNDFFKFKVPSHIAITMEGINSWAVKNKVSLSEGHRRSFEVINNIIVNQVNLGIPMVTFYLLPGDIDRTSEEFSTTINAIKDFTDSIQNSEWLNANKIKVNFLGKWYDLPGNIVESIKKLVGATKENNEFFVNFCVNYDGHEEITNACRLIAFQVKGGKIDPQLITKESIKQNLYSSNLLPPELIIRNGYKKTNTGLLLWDTADSKLYFSNRLFPDFERIDFMDAIREFQKGESL